MCREEKRRKFNEAVLNTLYPSPSPLPEEEGVPLSILRQDFAELESDGDDDGEGGSETQELTRAQRKRIRKKKLKEDASWSKQIIGPLLPSTLGDGQTCTLDVRRNASEKSSEQPPQAGCSNQKNKVKQRRKAKKLAREREQH